MNLSREIPETWVLATVGDVCSQPQYGYTTKASKSGDLRLLRTSDITSGRIDWGTVPFCSENPDDLGKYLLKEGDILVSRAGSVGVSHLVKEPLKAVFASYLIRFNPYIDRRYLGYFLQSPDYWTAIADEKLGIAVPNVNATKLKSIKIPIPPEREQHRIVTKIEELLSDLDKGVESLKTARAKLNIYRQAVLKHAFEGKLTARWREENKDKLETSELLFTRIKQEREECYEQLLQVWKTSLSVWEKGSKSDKRPVKPKRPRPLSDFAQNQPRTDHWPKFELGDLVSVSSGQSLTSNAMREGRYPVYGGNGITGYHREYLVSDPTLIIGRVGAKCGVTHITLENSWITDNALIVSPLIGSFDKRFFKYLLELKNLNTLGSSTGQPVISGGKIYPVRISLPTLAEQIQIADIIEKVNSSIYHLKSGINDQLLKIEKLRESILKKAFSGQLVPQDPEDEPASILLERIKDEKSARSQINKRTKRRREKATA